MTIDDSLQTTTSIDQAELERRVAHIYATEYADGKLDLEDEEGLSLNPQQHIKYLYGGLGQLPSGFISLDASRTWICYWVTHSLALLGAPLPKAPDRDSIIAFIASCQHPEGGFGGGPYQLAHLAPTYAAVSTLVTLGGADALGVVDRPKLLSFLLRMCVPAEQGGGMTMHEGGEVDVRGCYCALAACEMLLLDKSAVADACGMVDYICRCQSHEGGIGGEPWNEAHGGYTFCGLAAAALLGKAHALDLDRLLRWAVRCQGQVEGGFMGRTNKLVDGCYSFWQGGVFPLLVALLKEQQGAAAVSAAAKKVAPSTAADVSGTAAAVDRIIALLAADSGDDDSTTLAEWVASLPHLSPQAAAERRQQDLQKQLDAVVEASIEAEDRYKAAAGVAAGGPLQQQALALLDKASELQKALESCQQHVDAISRGAATLLDQALPTGSSVGSGEAEQLEGLPLLYDAAALQLWLLKCCQVMPRGGLRDKPGKPADYYHTCYCLSGLSCSQHYSGIVLGGAQNQLVRADPLCNVVATKLEAAQEHFKGTASQL